MDEETDRKFKSNATIVLRSAQPGSWMFKGIEKVAYYLSTRGYGHKDSNNWNNAQTMIYIWSVRNTFMLPGTIQHLFEKGKSLDTIANEIIDFYEKSAHVA